MIVKGRLRRFFHPSGLLAGDEFPQGPTIALVPASLALIREAYSNARERARAIAVWSLGAAVASCAGPVVGGSLTLLSWRTIFFINLPVVWLHCTCSRRFDAPQGGRHRLTGLGR